MPKLSYVTVCVDYLDFLAITYKHNRGTFDEMVVVTAPRDTATQSFCASNDITCVVTDAFYRDGAVFNKGRAINEGFATLKDPEWVAFMDADTFLAPGTALKDRLPSLDIQWLYGAERVIVPTYESYLKLLNGVPQALEAPKGAGFGFYQLWHWGSKAIQDCVPGEWYPWSMDCTECDWRFLHRWGDYQKGSEYTIPIGRFGVLPFKVINLGQHGVNHQGRRSPEFTASVAT